MGQQLQFKLGIGHFQWAPGNLDCALWHRQRRAPALRTRDEFERAVWHTQGRELWSKVPMGLLDRQRVICELARSTIGPVGNRVGRLVSRDF
jgi:hypothetical protein